MYLKVIEQSLVFSCSPVRGIPTPQTLMPSVNIGHGGNLLTNQLLVSPEATAQPPTTRTFILCRSYYQSFGLPRHPISDRHDGTVAN